MRRLISLFLLFSLTVSLGACSMREKTTTFYYLRNAYLPGTEDGVIAPEERYITGDRGLNYDLRLYLEGPASDLYKSPFPKGLYLLSTKAESDRLVIYLSPEFADLEDMDLTLACVCLARTCFGLTNAENIQIISEGNEKSVSFTLSRDSFALIDNLPIHAAIP